MTPEVTVYSQPGCPACKVLKDKLTTAHIPFTTEEDIDVLESKGIMHVPLLEVNSQMMDMAQALQFIKEYKGGDEN